MGSPYGMLQPWSSPHSSGTANKADKASVGTGPFKSKAKHLFLNQEKIYVQKSVGGISHYKQLCANWRQTIARKMVLTVACVT